MHKSIENDPVTFMYMQSIHLKMSGTQSKVLFILNFIGFVFCRNIGCYLRENTYPNEDYFICSLMKITELKTYQMSNTYLRLTLMDFPVIAGRRTMAKQWFQMKANVKIFILTDTTLNVIEDDAFNAEQFVDLHKLVMEDVTIDTIKANAFRGLIYLTDIYLSGLKMLQFAETTLVTVPHLNNLHLLNCGPNKLTLNLFQCDQLNQLKSVCIENCNLHKTIGQKTFSSLGNIKQLRLPSNQIIEIGVKSFIDLYDTLNHLDLSGNKLISIPAELYEMRNMPITLNLNGNPWHCNCAMEILRIFLQNTQTATSFEITCQTPLKYSRKELKHLPYLCNDTQISSNRESLMSDPKNIEVMCEYINSPETMITIGYTVPVSMSLPSFGFENGNIFINKTNFPKSLDLVGITESYTKHNKTLLNCMNVKSKGKRVEIESKLSINQIYRFCAKQKGINSIMPSDCVVLISTLDPTNQNDVHQISDPLSSLFCHFVFLVYGLIIGLGASLGMIKYFPHWIFRQQPVAGSVFVMFRRKTTRSRPLLQ